MSLATPAAAPRPPAAAPDPAPSRLTALAEAVADRANPVLVRFVRQQLKSRAFLLIYVVMLLAATAFTLSIGSHTSGAEGDAALDLLGALAAVWSLAVWIFEPISLYRAVTGEREDATWDLVELTGMRPRTVLGGLFQAALVHAGLYAAAVAPFVVMAYLLRGVDLATVFALLLYVPLVGLAGAATAIFAGCVGLSRTVRTLMSVTLTLGCIGVWFSHMPLWGGFDDFARFVQRVFHGPLPWVAFGGILNFFLAWVVLMLALSAALLTPRVANRSTLPRVVWYALSLNAVAWLVTVGYLNDDLTRPLGVAAVFGAFAAALLGLFSVTEDFELTPRQARDLRATRPLLRPFMLLFGPGAARGRLAFLAMAGVTLALAWVSRKSFYNDQPGVFAASFLSLSAVHLLLGDALARGPLRGLCPTPLHRRALVVTLLLLGSILSGVLLAMSGGDVESVGLLSPIPGAWLLVERHGLDTELVAVLVAGGVALVTLALQAVTRLRVTTQRVAARTGDRNPRAE